MVVVMAVVMWRKLKIGEFEIGAFCFSRLALGPGGKTIIS